MVYKASLAKRTEVGKDIAGVDVRVKRVGEKRLRKLLEIRPWIINPNNTLDQLYGLPFLESSKPTRTPIPDHKSIVLVSNIPMTCVFLLFDDVTVCHHPTFDPISI